MGKQDKTALKQLRIAFSFLFLWAQLFAAVPMPVFAQPSILKIATNRLYILGKSLIIIIPLRYK